jgi:hypothetical protein
MVGCRGNNLHESFLMKPGIPGFGAANLSISIPRSQGHYHHFFMGLIGSLENFRHKFKHWLSQLEFL